MKIVLKKIFISLGIISITFVAVWAAFGFPRGEYFWLLSITCLALLLGYLSGPNPLKGR